MDHNWVKYHSRFYDHYSNEEKCINCDLETYISYIDGERHVYGWCFVYLGNTIDIPTCEEYIIKKIIE
jgi:hypothetical protein